MTDSAPNSIQLQTDRYQGEIISTYASDAVVTQLGDIKSLLSSATASKLSKGADYVVKCQLELATGPVWIAVKVFKQQSFWKDWYDKKNKSKAQRSFVAAQFLQKHEIGTPSPIAWLEQWKGNRLIESYYVCLFEPSACFRDLISEILWDKRDSQPFIELLLHLAPAVRAMHDAGFIHGDMGNQNIFIPKDTDGNWLAPQWIDLNRSKMLDRPLNAKERAFDISRMIMPSGYLRWFLYIYSNHQPIDKELEKYENKYRQSFTRHRRNSKFRHPIRYLKRKKNTRTIYPHPKNVWLWDEKTAQPMITMTKKDKAQYREWRFLLSSFWKTLTALPKVWIEYKKQLDQSFKNPIEMKNRIGFALNIKDNYLQHELALHEKAGKPPVLIRFYHHETETDWKKSIELIQKLTSDHVSIMVAFIQDRAAVINPESWKGFLQQVIPAIANAVEHIEITHAYNRVKWGIWNNRELIGLMQPAFELQKTYPQIKLTGPACIDFEYAPVIAALKSLPKAFHFSALSHLLYVDRRGAPENHQGKFSTLEKSALLKSLAVISPNCENKVIISEVNWPVKHTGIWSPVICPYITPKWRKLEPGEPEDIYAHFMLRYLAITICSGHIDQVFWWRLSAHGYGLIDDLDNFRERPAFKALAFFLDLLGDARFERKLPSEPDTYLLEFSKNNRVYLMAWATQNIKPLDISCQDSWDYLGNQTKVEKLTGAPIYLEIGGH